MGDILYRKAVVPVIIALFIAAGCIPIIHGELFKKDDNASPNLKTKTLPNNLDFISAFILDNVNKKDKETISTDENDDEHPIIESANSNLNHNNYNTKSDDSSKSGIYFSAYHNSSGGSIYQEYKSSGDSGSFRYNSSYEDGTVTINEIYAEGSGDFTTKLDPEPSHTWAADAYYSEDGVDNPDSGSGTMEHSFPHSWQEKFQGEGTYSID